VSGPPRRVDYDGRAITLDGARRFLWSGAIHYPRSMPEQWPALMRHSRALGLTAIETYAFWGQHEAERGHYDFSGRLDLPRFLDAAAQEGLDVILRIGPYICAEINYGGFPFWLRDVPGMQMRTWNAPFMLEMERWTRHLARVIEPWLAGRGGPIILAQIENEYALVARNYGEAGQRYLRWAIELGQSLELDIPWLMCFGGMPGSIETINAFHGHTQIDAHAAAHPEQPLLWTENWTGWYDVFGRPHRTRPVADLLYAVCAFVARGGTGVNYYMWHGGTNFGREAMYLQTTSYDYDAPLDEFGAPTAKARRLADLHAALLPFLPTLLHSARPQPEALAGDVTAWSYRDGGPPLTFVCNDGRQAVSVEVDGMRLLLAARSAQLISQGRLVFDTAQPPTAAHAPARFRTLTTPRLVGAWAEPMPGGAEDRRPAVRVAEPVEQLALTRDRSDYAWYSTTLRAAGSGTLVLSHAADFVRVFVDGRPVASTALPLEEDRGDLDGPAGEQQFALDLAPGEHRLDVLCCALGLIKGDWQLGHRNMAHEKKGLWGPVTWEGMKLDGWIIRPGLLGEGGVPWQPADAVTASTGLRWLRFAFHLDAVDPHAAYVADLGGVDKGLAWLNGVCVGRYWTVPALAPSEPGLLARGAVVDTGAGEPTQKTYHLPVSVLRAGGNELVLFEESGGRPEAVTVLVRKEKAP